MNRKRVNEVDNTSKYVMAGVTAAAAGLAAVAGGLYWLNRNNERPQSSQTQNKAAQPKTQNMSSTHEGQSSSTVSTDFAGSSAPDNPCISNLNALLSDIHMRFIKIKEDDFNKHYTVLDSIFQHLHKKMKEVDPYYRKYSSTVQFAGSHSDNLRIKKPDEFDMDIVISLPLNMEASRISPADSDVGIEPKQAGFVHVKMGVQFQRLPMRDGIEWLNNKAAYEWMDDACYLQRNKFLDWFKSVATRALNTFDKVDGKPVYHVRGVPYVIGTPSSGPAFTMVIENKSKGFRLDVDLVPALRFPESRWPVSPRYRPIPPHCSRQDWLLVAKAPRSEVSSDVRRCWRLALHAQERQLMHDSHNLRQAVRLIKKLRDSLRMDKIASYYIKTLFFWEIVAVDDVSFWQRNSPAFLFKLMVRRLHAALVNRKIPYFWNGNNNLIGSVPDSVLFSYAAKLVPLMQILEIPQEYKKVAKYLLEPHEFKEYNAKFLHI